MSISITHQNKGRDQTRAPSAPARILPCTLVRLSPVFPSPPIAVKPQMAAAPGWPRKNDSMTDLRSLHRAFSRVELRTAADEPGRRPQSAGALTGLGRIKVGAPWLAAPPPRPNDAAALARWVQRRLISFSGTEVVTEGRGHTAAAWGVSEVLLWLRCSAGLEQYAEAFAVGPALPCFPREHREAPTAHPRA